MPFTFAHPSVILPFKNKYFNLSGLALGSMAPDFIYFILFAPSSNIGHTLLGFISFNLPICFLLNYVFYKYIQELFIISMPNFISVRYLYLINNKNVLSNRNDVLRFIYSCLVGMFTHVFWDSFTHKTGFFVNHIQILRNSVMIFNMDISFYKILQHGSTLIGFIIIFIYIYKMGDTKKSIYKLKVVRYKIYLSIISIFIITMIICINIFIYTDTFIGIGRFIITSINSFLIAYLITGFILSNKFTNYVS